jgi:hypothetical protein
LTNYNTTNKVLFNIIETLLVFAPLVLNLVEVDDVVLDEGLSSKLDESLEGFPLVIGRTFDQDLGGGHLLQAVRLVAEAATFDEETERKTNDDG